MTQYGDPANNPPSSSGSPYPSQNPPVSGGGPFGQPAPLPPEPVQSQTPDSSSGPAASAPTTTPPSGFDERGKVRRTRTSELYLGLALGTLVLIALIIFIAQNTTNVAIHFLGFAGHFPLALALLIAAVAGVVLAIILGGLRILQLRRALKRNARAHREQAGRPDR